MCYKSVADMDDDELKMLGITGVSNVDPSKTFTISREELDDCEWKRTLDKVLAKLRHHYRFKLI